MNNQKKDTLRRLFLGDAGDVAVPQKTGRYGAESFMRYACQILIRVPEPRRGMLAIAQPVGGDERRSSWASGL